MSGEPRVVVEGERGNLSELSEKDRVAVLEVACGGSMDLHSLASSALNAA